MLQFTITPKRTRAAILRRWLNENISPEVEQEEDEKWGDGHLNRQYWCCGETWRFDWLANGVWNISFDQESDAMLFKLRWE